MATVRKYNSIETVSSPNLGNYIVHSLDSGESFSFTFGVNNRLNGFL